MMVEAISSSGTLRSLTHASTTARGEVLWRRRSRMVARFTSKERSVRMTSRRRRSSVEYSR